MTIELSSDSRKKNLFSWWAREKMYYALVSLIGSAHDGQRLYIG